jgi:site-specific recombinase XerD
MNHLILSIQKFLDEEKVNGTKPNTIRTYVSFLNKADNFKAEEGGLSEAWTRDDINAFIRSLQDEGYAATSIEVCKGITKKFWRWAGKPEIIDHLKIKMPEKSLRRDQILTVEDIELLIRESKDLKYKAIIAFLFDSEARISEVVRVIQVKDIQETPRGMIIPVYETKEKTDFRPIGCVYSAQYIRNYIESYNLKPDDILFDLAPGSVWRYLRDLGKRVGLKKPVRPHAFRHAGIVDMSLRGYSDAIIRKKVGHSPGSKMLSRYQHIINDDVLDATFGNSNIEKPKELITPKELIVKNKNVDLDIGKLQTDNEDLRAEIYQNQKDFEAMKAEMEQMKREQIAFFKNVKAKYEGVKV